MPHTGNDIAERMMKIRGIHEEAQMRAAAIMDDETLIAYLETTDEQFRSIAYEGASMARGLQDIAANDSLDHWSAYMQRTRAHAVQVHIGLGWAIAQRQVPIFARIQNLSPVIQARIVDGIGYYEGMFRNRTTIRDKVVPEVIKGVYLRAYDQGVGRCLWYMAKGNVVQLKKLIDGFSDDRKPDLWRGLGIASSYISGPVELLTALFDTAGPYKIQMASGAAFLTHSRAKAGTINEETELACKLWCRMTTDEVVAIMNQTEPVQPGSEDAYVLWVQAVEEELNKVSHRV